MIEIPLDHCYSQCEQIIYMVWNDYYSTAWHNVYVRQNNVSTSKWLFSHKRYCHLIISLAFSMMTLYYVCKKYNCTNQVLIGFALSLHTNSQESIFIILYYICVCVCVYTYEFYFVSYKWSSSFSVMDFNTHVVYEFLGKLLVMEKAILKAHVMLSDLD